MNDGRSWSLIWSMALRDTCAVINADHNLISFFFFQSMWVSRRYCCWFVIDGKRTTQLFFSLIHIFRIRKELVWVIQQTRTARPQHREKTKQRRKKKGLAQFNQQQSQATERRRKKGKNGSFVRVRACQSARLLFASCNAQFNSIFTFLCDNLTSPNLNRIHYNRVTYHFQSYWIHRTVNDDAFASYYCFVHYVHYINHSASLACWLCRMYEIIEKKNLFVLSSVRIDNVAGIWMRCDWPNPIHGKSNLIVYIRRWDEKQLALTLDAYLFNKFSFFINRINFRSFRRFAIDSDVH